MSETTRVPRTIRKFNDYIKDSDDHLQSDRASTPIYSLLGLDATQAGEWSTRRLYWEDTLYPKWSSPNTKTPTVNLEVKNVMDSFIEFSRPLLNIMAVNLNATEEDEKALNFKRFRKEPVHPTAPIDEDVYLDLKPKGGGDMRIRCRSEKEATRASIPDGAKAVELAYLIGTSAPESVAECTNFKTSTKALFNINVGAANAGNKMYCYARWIDTSNLARAGSWTDMVVSGIL